MKFSFAWAALIAVGISTGCGRAAGQESTGGNSRPSDRRSSPIDTLERLTGERGTESGRERDEIETDRDSFTPATTTVGRGRLVAESAYTFIDNRGIKETHSVPELLLRYGVTDRVELRLGWNYEVGGTGNAVSGLDAGDEDPTRGRATLVRDYTLSYGLKVRVSDQDRWMPRTVAILQGFTPTGGSAASSTATQLVATYAAGWDLPNRWKFDTAIRYGTQSEDGDHFHQWAPSAVLKVPLGEKWATHVEYFGIFTSGKEQNTPQHYFSPGLHYLVTPDVEVGFRLGWGLNAQSDRFFVNTGFGGRF